MDVGSLSDEEMSDNEFLNKFNVEVSPYLYSLLVGVLMPNRDVPTDTTCHQ